MDAVLLGPEMTDAGVPIGFWRIAAADPGRAAVVDPAGRPITYGELASVVNRISNGLRAAGLRRGDGISVILPNDRIFVDVYLAAVQIGLYFTAINWHLTADEIAYILEDSETALVVAHQRFAHTSREAADAARVPADRRFAVGSVPGFRPVDQLWQGQPDSRPADPVCGQQML
jgi:long-chain acyl-CoA synthetase